MLLFGLFKILQPYVKKAILNYEVNLYSDNVIKSVNKEIEKKKAHKMVRHCTPQSSDVYGCKR